MKYIDAEHLRKEVKGLERAAHKSALGCADSETRKFHEGKDFAYQHVGILIDSLQQEQPKFTRVPRIEQETQKKGWVDYGLMISEIGLHRSNAIDRIKETKERAAEIKRNIAPHDLAILGKYLESAGAEIVLCCLQQHCMDSMFTQDEVKQIIQQEQPEVDLEDEWKEYYNNCLISRSPMNKREIARHFFNLGKLNARKEENK